MAEADCALCRNVGWVFDCHPGKSPLALEVIPCPHPECQVCGREIQNLCFKGVRFAAIAKHPSEGWVMSLSNSTLEDWVISAHAQEQVGDSDGGGEIYRDAKLRADDRLERLDMAEARIEVLERDNQKLRDEQREAVACDIEQGRLQ